jgi:DNA-binding beta-propeller fold protein YncE
MPAPINRTPNRRHGGRRAVKTAALMVAALLPSVACGQNLFFGSIGEAGGLPNHLLTSDLDGLGLTNILPRPGGPVSVDVDPVARRVFWTDMSSSPGQWQLRSASFTGGSPTVLATYNGGYYGLAVDSLNRQVYWPDGATIRRCDYNGSGAITIATGGGPQAIEVDPVAGKVFWADWRGTPQIGMANLDGTNPQTLISLPPGGHPSGITVDPTTATLYWSDFASGEVSSISYSGGPVSTILTGLFHPAGLDLELTSNRLYVVSGGTLGWSAPSGGALTTVFTASGQYLGEMQDVAAIIPGPAGLSLLVLAGLTAARRAR